MKNKVETKCKKCGSERFWLNESLGWKCYIDPDTGSLECKNCHNEIEDVICLECGEVLDYDHDNEINFN